ncbi:flagellar filament capping protein FliD [Paenibacillus illinoisensis]|uniref:flagellar filament capping protein FliD n=1 Tax=Paenibacillus illinoisensis TaxID=59845 RepID=UPI00203AA53E|nr:flagellar filament capping protein FliD [Paenibacillus illinoisensis]MCM3208581.1 flagellar filament capping protein FliD [Paenibacillus illinoisensis]
MSTIKLSGMVSGLDTDTIIKQLMQVERSPLNKLEQQKQKIAWKRDDYREMNTMLTSIQSLANQMRFSSSFTKQTATSSDTSIVSASSSSAATSGGYSIKVDKLASSALVAGSNVAIDPKTKVGVDGSFEIVGPKGTKTITVTADSTYDSVLKQVNASGTGVTMSYDSINGRFMIGTNATGASASLEIKDTSGIASSAFGLSTPAAVKGSNATIQLNGQSMDFENNAFEFNGVRFDIKGVSTSAVSVTVAQDTTAIVDQIKSFVNQYNTLVDTVKSKTTSVPSRSYAPLTDEQKESMTESQIELWEKKAKVGLLYKDDILTSALSSLRSVLMNKVSGLPSEMDSLSDIGITFKAYSGGNTNDLGKLSLDEAKLKDAVTSNPDGVMNLFTRTSNLDPKDANYQNETGYGDRLYSTLSTHINKIIKRIGTSTVSDAVDSSQLGKEIRTINDSMSTLKTRLQAIEDRYYKQFTAMELALQKLNSKGSWITSQLGS